MRLLGGEADQAKKTSETSGRQRPVRWGERHEGWRPGLERALVGLTFTGVVLHADASYFSLFWLRLNNNGLISACSAKRSELFRSVELPPESEALKAQEAASADSSFAFRTSSVTF